MAEYLLYEYKTYMSGAYRWYKYTADKKPLTNADLMITPVWPSDQRIYKTSAQLRFTNDTNKRLWCFNIFRGSVVITRYRKDSESGSYYLVDSGTYTAKWPDSNGNQNVYSTDGNDGSINVNTYNNQNYWNTKVVGEGSNFEPLSWYTDVPIVYDYSATEWGNLIRTEYIPSSWQSVISLTGKGKTVQLSTLNDVNNGEEVITDDTSKFNLTTASNLVTLVQK